MLVAEFGSRQGGDCQLCRCEATVRSPRSHQRFASRSHQARKTMSTFRRIDYLLDGKTSEELSREVAARERERAEQGLRRRGQPPNPKPTNHPDCVTTTHPLDGQAQRR